MHVCTHFWAFFSVRQMFISWAGELIVISPSMQYSVPVIKYDRNGFRPRFRQLIFTQAAAYLVEEAKIKQRVNYSSLKGKSQ